MLQTEALGLYLVNYSVYMYILHKCLNLLFLTFCIFNIQSIQVWPTLHVMMTASASQAFSAHGVCLKEESVKTLEQRDSLVAKGFFQEIYQDVLRVWCAEELGKFDSDCIDT